MKNSIATRVAGLIETTVAAFDLELWGVEHIQQGKYSILRIYIEREEGGVTIEDCEKVSRQLSSLFDVEDPVPGEYSLEVSSPGLDRPLFTVRQFERYTGSEVNLRMRGPVSGRRRFRGLITGVNEDVIALRVDGADYDLQHADVEKANIISS